MASAVVLVLGLAMFAWRGLWRAPSYSADFMVIYTSARCWLTGQNPYDYGALNRIMQATPGLEGQRLDPLARPSLYPPGTYLLLAGPAAMPYPLARNLWILLNAASLMALIAAMARVIRVRIGEPGFWLLAGASLLLAPVQTAFAIGQTTLPALALLAWGLTLAHHRATLAPAVLYALALVIKPQVVLPMLAYELLRGLCRWRPVVVALLIALIITLIGGGWLAGSHPSWFGDWREGMRLNLVGGLGDPTAANPRRFHLLNLHVLLHLLIDSRTLVNLLAVSACALGGLLAIVRVRACRVGASPPTVGGLPSAPMTCDLWGWSVVSVLTLLVTYHLFYDAAMLAWPVAWCVAMLTGPTLARTDPPTPNPVGKPPRAVWLVIAALATFVVPAVAALESPAIRMRLPHRLTDHDALWIALRSHSILALILIVGALLVIGPRGKRVAPDAPRTVVPSPDAAGPATPTDPA